MSYILDALKKSEQERGHGSVPGVQTVHSSSINYGNEKKSYWPYLLIVAVLLNFAAIIYFIYDKDRVLQKEIAETQEKDIVTSKQPLTYPDEIAVSPAVSKKEISAKKTSLADSSQSAAAAAEVTTEEAIPVDSNQMENNDTPVAKHSNAGSKDIVDFYDLPESIQQQLPAIIISAHVYSSNPQQRSIVVNNNFMEEGEYVIDDLVLFEITPDGAVFDYKDTRFHYGVVRSWQ